jgi:hypothetical protein
MKSADFPFQSNRVSSTIEGFGGVKRNFGADRTSIPAFAERFQNEFKLSVTRE